MYTTYTEWYGGGSPIKQIQTDILQLAKILELSNNERFLDTLLFCYKALLQAHEGPVQELRYSDYLLSVLVANVGELLDPLWPTVVSRVPKSCDDIILVTLVHHDVLSLAVVLVLEQGVWGLQVLQQV